MPELHVIPFIAEAGTDGILPRLRRLIYFNHQEKL